MSELLPGVQEDLLSSAIEDWDLPSVSFDIELGKKFAYIDFDYESYIDHLTANGLSGKQIADTSVKFHCNNPLASIRGRYGGGEMDVYVSKDVNAVLVHETQHRIDDVKGELTGKTAELVYAKKKMKAGKFIWLGSIVGEAIGYAIQVRDLSIGASVLNLAAAASYWSGYIDYRSLEPEKQARRAAKEIKTQFVTVS